MSFETFTKEKLRSLFASPHKHINLISKIIIAAVKDNFKNADLQQELIYQIRKSSKIRSLLAESLDSIPLEPLEPLEVIPEVDENAFAANNTNANSKNNYAKILQTLVPNAVTFVKYEPMPTKLTKAFKKNPLDHTENLLTDPQKNAPELAFILNICHYNKLKNKTIQEQLLNRLKSDQNVKEFVYPWLKLPVYLALIENPSPAIKGLCDELAKTTCRSNVQSFRAIKDLPTELINDLVLELAYYPQLTKLFPYLKQLPTITLHDAGGSIDNWSPFARVVLDKTHFKLQRHPVVTEFIEEMGKKIERPTEKTTIQTYLNKGWHFLRIQGRTILLQHQQNPNLLALKVQKKDEHVDELHRQHLTVEFLAKNHALLGLEGECTHPHGVKSVDGISNWLKTLVSQHKLDENTKQSFLNSIRAKKDAYKVYIYEADKHYFTYLHNPKLSTKEFFSSAKVALNNLIVLLQQGIVYDRIADLFHNQESGAAERVDAGRYLALVNLMRNMRRSGGGRLNAWEKAVDFPNLRMCGDERINRINTGLADEGDWHPLEAFTNPHAPLAKQFFIRAHELHGEKVSLFIVANFLAEFLLTFELIAGKRVMEQIRNNPTITETEKKFLWEETTEQLFKLYSFALSKITNLPNDVAHRLFTQSTNYQDYAEQMRYWLSGDYIADIKKNHCKPGIFGSNAQIIIDFNKIRKGTFTQEKGFSIDNKNADIGSVNSQYLLKWGEMLRYFLTTFCFPLKNTIDESQHAQQKGLHALQQGKYDEAEAHLTHAIKLNPFSVETRRHLVKVSADRIAYSPELKNNPNALQTLEKHRKDAHVAIIQRFWRERKLHQPHQLDQHSAENMMNRNKY